MTGYLCQNHICPGLTKEREHSENFAVFNGEQKKKVFFPAKVEKSTSDFKIALTSSVFHFEVQVSTPLEVKTRIFGCEIFVVFQT